MAAVSATTVAVAEELHQLAGVRAQGEARRQRLSTMTHLLALPQIARHVTGSMTPAELGGLIDHELRTAIGDLVGTYDFEPASGRRFRLPASSVQTATRLLLGFAPGSESRKQDARRADARAALGLDCADVTWRDRWERVFLRFLASVIIDRGAKAEEDSGLPYTITERLDWFEFDERRRLVTVGAVFALVSLTDQRLLEISVVHTDPQGEITIVPGNGIDDIRLVSTDGTRAVVTLRPSPIGRGQQSRCEYMLEIRDNEPAPTHLWLEPALVKATYKGKLLFTAGRSPRVKYWREYLGGMNGTPSEPMALETDPTCGCFYNWSARPQAIDTVYRIDLTWGRTLGPHGY